MLCCFGCHPQVAKTEKVAVGSLSLHVVCAGKGRPAVVFDSGLGTDSTVWAEVQRGVSRFTQACAYDRAGLGSSSPAPRPHGNLQMADELHRLLSAAGVPGPFVFVGHSMGAVNVRLLASSHPDEVAGVVLLDPMTAAQQTTFWPLFPEDKMKAFQAGVAKLPEGIDFELLAKGLEEAKARGSSLGDEPVIVLTSGKQEGFPGASAELTARMLRGWQAAQAEVLHLSSDEAHVVVEGSGHFIQHDAPRLVVSSIREVIDAIREGRRLNARVLSGTSD